VKVQRNNSYSSLRKIRSSLEKERSLSKNSQNSEKSTEPVKFNKEKSRCPLPRKNIAK
jgi:hypothetical protein